MNITSIKKEEAWFSHALVGNHLLGQAGGDHSVPMEKGRRVGVKDKVKTSPSWINLEHAVWFTPTDVGNTLALILPSVIRIPLPSAPSKHHRSQPVVEGFNTVFGQIVGQLGQRG